MSQHIYTYDPANDQLNEIGGAGHIIKNESGTSFTKRENLQFDGMKVSDDATNNATIVAAVETNFVGTWAQWQALTLAERAQYKTVDLTDDFNGDPIDAVPTEDSPHAVSSGGTYAEIQTLTNNDDAILNVLGAKNLLPNKATTQTLNGVTFTVNSDKSVTVSGTATANTYYQLSWVKDISLEVGKSYVISGCPNGSSDNSYYIYMNVNGENIKVYDEEVSFTFSSYVTDSEVAIKITNGAVISTPITFKPMIRPASVADDTYVPYAMTNRELSINKKFSVGTTNITAIKYGNVVMLRIALQGQVNTYSSGWNSLGVLPVGLRPVTQVDTIISDNGATSFANSINPIRIGVGGEILLWVYSEKLVVRPLGHVMYIAG